MLRGLHLSAHLARARWNAGCGSGLTALGTGAARGLAYGSQDKGLSLAVLRPPWGVPKRIAAHLVHGADPVHQNTRPGSTGVVIQLSEISCPASSAGATGLSISRAFGALTIRGLSAATLSALA